MRTVNYRLSNKLDEVFTLKPNDLGNVKLTFFYHRVTVLFKKMPFIIIIPAAFFLTLIAYFFFGVFLVKLVTLLQYGF